MKRFDLVLSFPAGSVMVGGYSALPDGLHGGHAEAADGQPLIPATALRGALREALEAVLRGAGHKACSGGDGVDPGQGSSDPIPCTLEGGSRCKACLLFGSQRGTLGPGEAAFSALVLGDAVAEGAHEGGWTLRPGVGVTRRSRSAEDGRLFIQRVPSTPGQRYVARGQLLDPTMARYLSAAARATTHIGAGRSRGLARVVVDEPVFHDVVAPAPAPATTGDVRVRVKLLSPAFAGAAVVYPNLAETRDEIPGATLRGAIGFALAAALGEEADDPAFQALVAEGGASFGFLWPVDGDDDGPADPLPITAAACKAHGRAHGVVDTLLDRLAAARVTESGQALAVEQSGRAACAVCRQPLRALAGWRRRHTEVPRRTVTRVALDRTQSSARDERLFTRVLLDAGTVFEGVIRDIPTEGRAHLARGLSLPLSLGRGRSAGWGRVEITALGPPVVGAIADRGAAFDDALSARLAAAGLPLDEVGRLVPLTLLSPLIVEDGTEARDLLLRGLDGATCALEARRFSREGGWDQRGKGMEPALATAAGGVFVIDVGEGRTWRDVLSWIEGVEKRGHGRRSHQGYGRVMAFDPVFVMRGGGVR